MTRSPMMRLTTRGAILPLLVVILWAARAAAEPPVTPIPATPPVPSEAELLTRLAPAIVQVKVVMKTELNMGEGTRDQESTIFARGAFVDPSGLLMLWNSQLSSTRLMEVLGRFGGGEGFKLKMTPTDFQVLVGGSDKEQRAFLAASDSELDLAFLQIEAPPVGPYPYVDFDLLGEAAVGDRVLAVSRLGESFDYAPYVETALLGGEIAKPRRAFILNGQLTAMGLPIFDLWGRPVGVLTTVLSRLGSEGEAARGEMGGMIPLVAQRTEMGPLGVFVLPGARAREVIREARTRAAALLAERATAAAAEAGN